MNDVTLVYFEGCPESRNVRAALLTAGVYDFQVVLQNQLPPNDPLRKLSSPSVLKGPELIYGIRTNEEVASCTFDRINFVDEAELVQRFKELNLIEPPSGYKLRSFLGPSLASLLVLKCPACIPGLAAFLSAFGLGFVLTQGVLKLALISLLLLTLGGLVFSYIKSHRNINPLILAVIFSITLYIARFHAFGILENQSLSYVAVAGLIGTSLWDLRLRSMKKCSACP